MSQTDSASPINTIIIKIILHTYLTIGVAQQLLGKTKTIFGKELVYVKVSTIEAFKFLWLIDGKQRAVFFQETHLLPK